MMKACVISLTGLALLTGCTVQSTANGGFQVSTISLGQALGQAPAGQGAGTPNPAPSEQPGGSAGSVGDTGGASVMKFSGPMDGGDGMVILTAISSGQYDLDLAVKGQMAGAGVSGVVTRSGDVFTMSQGHLDGQTPEPCSLTLKLSGGDALAVSENYQTGGCMIFHGASISFDGMLSRVN